MPRPFNTARTYVPVGQLRPPSQIWTPWDASEDVVSTVHLSKFSFHMQKRYTQISAGFRKLMRACRLSKESL